MVLSMAVPSGLSTADLLGMIGSGFRSRGQGRNDLTLRSF